MVIRDGCAPTLRRSVSQFHSYEFGCDHHQICTQQSLLFHGAKQKGKGYQTRGKIWIDEKTICAFMRLGLGGTKILSELCLQYYNPIVILNVKAS